MKCETCRNEMIVNGWVIHFKECLNLREFNDFITEHKEEINVISISTYEEKDTGYLKHGIYFQYKKPKRNKK